MYSFLAKYVRKTHSDCEIKQELKNNEGMSFVDMITPSNIDIAFVISVIKNSREVWDQMRRMMSWQTEVHGEREKMRPLFTEGMGKKKQQSRSLWSDEEKKFYKHAERRWKELYKNESAMKDMYGGFENWLNKYGRNIIMAKNSTKSVHSVISTWVHEKNKKQLEHRLSENEGEHDSDNEEEDGYCSDKVTNRLSISWSKDERDQVDSRVEEEV